MPPDHLARSLWPADRLTLREAEYVYGALAIVVRGFADLSYLEAETALRGY